MPKKKNNQHIKHNYERARFHGKRDKLTRLIEYIVYIRHR